MAGGELTREEAVVRLVEAQSMLDSSQKNEGSELSMELEALGKDLKEKVAKGDMTDEEAKAAWLKAAGIAKSSAKAEGGQDTEKDKK